jgi:transcriptional regulator with XRE-family HTH domain
MNEDQKIGQIIKAFRLENGWTQDKMAVYLGISRPLIIRLEKGRGKLMDLTRAKIKKQLDMTHHEAVA